MSCSSFHDVTASKVRGTWNLHQAAQSLSIPLQFFTLLSSISGIIGTGGQANYAAGNVFLDAFAAYRHSLGLRAHSINLGVVDEVGYLSKHTITSKRAESKNALVAIDERTLHKIVKMSILQQMVPIEKKSQVQMITGLPLPLEPDSALFNDARFCTLRVVHDQSNSIDTNGSTSIATLLQQMLDANAKPSSITIEVIKLINDQMVKNLGLVEDIEPAKTWSSYGIDSLAAVDLRNWMRTQLKVDLSTLEILNAKSLLDLAERVVGVLRKESN
jgi:acyl carrier protein